MRLFIPAVAVAVIAGPGHRLSSQQTLAIRAAGSLYGSPFSSFGTALASGDVNGDGVSDLIVGARTYADGDAEDGAVFLHLGSSSGIDASPAWSTVPSGTQSLVGYAVACVDANADGYYDVVYSALDNGVVHMHLGSPLGPTQVPTWTASASSSFDYGTVVTSAGDTNGDGFEDLLISGDVSIPASSTGVVQLFSGGPLGFQALPGWESHGSAVGDLHGGAVSGRGDVNGDGFSDVLVGAPGFTGSVQQQGRVLLYLGGPAGPSQVPDWVHEGDSQRAFLGEAVSLIGDINGDGLGDLAVSQWEGRKIVCVFLGRQGVPGPVPDFALIGHSDWLVFGVAIAPAGDVNGDNLDDVLIGSFPAPPYHYAGHVELLLGRSTAPCLVASWEKHETQIDALFGLAMCSIGDLNRDGLGDFAVGAEGYDLDLENEGRVVAYLGSRLTKRTGWRLK